MLILLLVSVVVVAAPPIQGPAMTQCPTNAKPSSQVVATLLRVEVEERVPKLARGILLAAACLESAYRADPGCGDRGASCGMFQFQGWARRWIRAVQLETGLGTADPRLDYEASARYYWRHLIAQLPAVRRHCRGYGGYATRLDYVLASAATTASRHPRCARRGYRCAARVKGRCVRHETRLRCVKRVPRCARRGTKGESNHWRLLQRWRRGLRRDVQRPTMGDVRLPWKTLP